MDGDVVKMIEHLQFKMDLLFQNTEFSRFLYQCNITEEQNRDLGNLMDKYMRIIDNGQEVSSTLFETEALKIVNNPMLDYHFCELYAKLCWKEERWEEVFPKLYGDNLKFRHFFEK